MNNNVEPDAKTRPAPRVIIIGAGAAGMLTAIRLMQAGIHDITIYEKAEDVGGTWRENRYPGVACDVPAHHYNYSFEPNPGWQNRLAKGAEIQQYFQGVAEKYDLRPLIVFGHAVTEAQFDGARWHMRTDKGREDTADFIVSATGPLHIPVIPDIAGLDSFAGDAFHTARWPDGLDVSGKKVGVIGNGSSGVQLLAALAARGIDVTLFMRTPQWVFPLKNRAVGPTELRIIRALPWIGRLKGAFYQWFFEHVWAEAVIHAGWERSFLSWMCHRNLASIKDPILREKLTPPDQPLCRRLVMSADFYPALQKLNVKLVQTPIDHIEPGGVTTSDGKLHELDALVLATGFWTRAYGRPIELTNETGATLSEAWQDHVGAYLSIHVPGFPNFMLVGGPNSPRGNFSAIAYSEAIVDHIVKCIVISRDNGFCSLEAKAEAQDKFETENSEGLATTAWVTGCRSWYLNEQGLPENWTGTPGEFRATLNQPDLTDFIVKKAAPQRVARECLS